MVSFVFNVHYRKRLLSARSSIFTIRVTLSNNLAQIQREREEAEKVAREELKRKQKTVGNGGAKAKTPDAKPREEEKAVAPPPPMMSLFDSPAEPEVQPGTRSNSQDALQDNNNNHHHPNNTVGCQSS